MSDAAFPTRIDFTEEDVEREASEVTISDGAEVMLVCDKAELRRTDNKEGGAPHLAVMSSWAVIDPENQSQRLAKVPRVSDWKGLPIPRKDEGYIPPDWATNMFKPFARAVFDGERGEDAYHGDPRQAKGKWFFGDEEIDPGEVAAKKKEAARARLELCNHILETNGETLLGRVVYATIKVKDDRTNINYRREAPKKGLTEVSDLLATGIPGSGKSSKKNGAAKSNGAAKRSRKAPAKTAKKPAGRRRARA